MEQQKLKTHWKKYFDPKFLGAHDFEQAKDKILTIRFIVEGMEFLPSAGKLGPCLIIHWDEKEKPFIINQTNSKSVAKIYGSNDPNSWISKKIQLYVTSVRVGKNYTDGVRIRDFIPVTTKQKCDKCSAEIVPFKGLSLTEHIEKTKESYGKQLCTDCATKQSDEKKNAYTPTGDK